MTKKYMECLLSWVSWCGCTSQLFLVVDPELHHSWKGPFKVMERLGKTIYKIKNLQGWKKTFVHFDRLKPCVASDEKLEHTGSREQAPVGMNLDLVGSDDEQHDEPVQQEEAAVPGIAIPPAPVVEEQHRYPVQDRQHTQCYEIYVEH